MLMVGSPLMTAQILSGRWAPLDCGKEDDSSAGKGPKGDGCDMMKGGLRRQR